jgi:7-carboxy-7-deazaguanine synthase
MLRISEIYLSIQGESTRAGLPCIFVRLTGCPLRCTWCDTTHGYSGGEEMEMATVMERIRALKCRRVEVTGGEPLAQADCPDLVNALLAENYEVLVETAGSHDISVLPQTARRIVDMKCPGSAMESRNDYANLDRLGPLDEVKFVIADETDFAWAVKLIRFKDLENRVPLLFAPVWETMKPERLAELILESGLDVRLQMQLHKIIWGSDRKGV